MKINYIKEYPIGGYIILILGILILITLFVTLIPNVPVWFFGRDTTGVIDDVWYEYLNKDDQTPNYFIQYHFDTLKGEPIIGNLQVPESTWVMYTPGQEIDVKYFPLDPTNSRPDDSRMATLLLCSNIPFILLSWFLIFVGRELIRD